MSFGYLAQALAMFAVSLDGGIVQRQRLASEMLAFNPCAPHAHSLYLTRKPAEQAELLGKVLLNCSIDAVSLYPTYRKPFDMIYRRAKNHEWSGREDLNLRPPGPEPGALPG